jgi:hypothetical protein
MLIGLAKLVDLDAMHLDMGIRFFERNIRSALPEEILSNVVDEIFSERILSCMS